MLEIKIDQEILDNGYGKTLIVQNLNKGEVCNYRFRTECGSPSFLPETYSDKDFSGLSDIK